MLKFVFIQFLIVKLVVVEGGRPGFGCGGDINAYKSSYFPECRPTCDNPDALTNCPANPQQTEIGCVCNPGYILDTQSGRCVLPNQCPPICGGDPNAQFDACGWCPQTCERLNDQLQCIALCRLPGNCGCKGGYVMNNQGKCVLPRQCPPRQCETSCEVYQCPAYCSPTLCRDRDVLYPCPPPTEEILDFCIPDCICKDGYLRDDNGNCVPRELCPPVP